MAVKTFFFAGGGTGGHIYPAMAVAERIIKLQPDANIRFFCGSGDIDRSILSKTGFEYTTVPACGFSARPAKLFNFCKSFAASYKIAKEKFTEASNPVVIGTGGFVAAAVCWAAYRKKVPLKLINVDAVVGRANKILARLADDIFVQFEGTEKYFKKTKAKIHVVGCPLRSRFQNPEPEKTVERLGLDKEKKILLITGASSGARSINEAAVCLLGRLEAFADDWQIVHVTGMANENNVRRDYANAGIGHTVIGYYDDMAGLLSAADLVVGRSGAVSAAEYAAAQVPCICVPYPHHKNRHQYKNAACLVEAGAGVIVDDLPDKKQRADRLAETLLELLRDNSKRQRMAEACKTIANRDAATRIAENLLA